MTFSDDDFPDMDPDELRQFCASVLKVGTQLLEQGKKAKEHEERWAKYHDDPCGYFRDVLGVEPWESADPEQHSQADLIRAVGKHDRVACKSGHKIGKSITAVGLALWFVCTRKNARVVLTAPTFHQVKNILWRELTNIYRARSLESVFGAALPLDPSTGLKFGNGNEIVGLSTKQPENMAGISAPEMLFIVDEASGFPDDIWQVLSKGNAAGGVKIFVISNPTRTAGWFFELFRSKNPYWLLFTISSENTPNAVSGVRLVPGLATRQFIEEVRKECGEGWKDDAVYMVRIRGEFPTQGSDAVIALAAVERSTMSWKRTAPAPLAELYIGVDVGRYGSDPSVAQPVRGDHAYDPRELFKADGPTVALMVIEYAKELRISDEQIYVVVDGIGVGASVVDALKYSEPVQDGWMVIVDLNVGEAPDDENHERLRDQLWFSCSDWIKDGGKMPDHDDLTRELLCATYSFTVRNRKKVMSKDQMRLILGRSPDYADALCLATYRGPRGRVIKGPLYESAPDPRHDSPRNDDWDEGGGGGKWSGGGFG